MRTPRMPSVSCPTCGGPAFARNIGTHTLLYRELYYHCRDWRCGHIFVVAMEALRTVRPSNLENPLHTLPRSNLRFHAANDAGEGNAPARIIETRGASS